MDRQKTSSGAIVDLNVTEGSEKWLSPHTRHQMTFKKKNNEQINSYLNASRHQIESDCGTIIYHLAIIDYLQAWNFDKKAEAFLKKTLKGKPPKLISCVPPIPY